MKPNELNLNTLASSSFFVSFKFILVTLNTQVSK